MSIEIGVDAREARRAAELVFRIADEFPFVGLVALRYVKQSNATFSMAQFPITCCIEIPAIHSRHTMEFYEELWAALEKEGIRFTQHIGQMNNYNEKNIRQHWGEDTVKAWVAARHKVLPNPDQRQRFSNSFLATLDMDS